MFKMIKKAALGLMLLSVTAGVSFAADSHRHQGSTTVLPVAQGTLEAFMKANPGIQMSLSGGGSGEGIKR
jgi:phosphate transport system substrate-binding protein